MKIGACAVLTAALVALAPGAAAAVDPPPANDAFTTPAALDGTQGSLSGTTVGATLAKTDPATACDSQLAATVWYSLTNVPARDVVLRLTAQAGLDAVVEVYRVRNGRLSSIDCAETDDNGVATLGVAAGDGDLVLVAQTTGSPSAAFTLQTLVPETPEAVPGRPLRGVAWSSVEDLLDVSDLWNAELRPGTTYRISFVATTPGTCPNLRLYEPGGPLTDARELLFLRCNSATSFTPGPDGGGRYLLLVGVAYGSGRIAYRLQVAPAQPDDTAPGLKLPVGVWRSARLAPDAVDQVDMYRFSIAARSDITLELGRPRAPKVSLLLLRDTGASLASGRAIRRQLAPGMYYVVVGAPAGSPAAAYRLRLRERGVSILTAPGLDHGHAPFGTEVTLSAVIGRPAGRTASLQIDRLDPLHGWLYDHTVKLPVSSSAAVSFAWRPPHVGTYRARIVAPSRSRYLLVTVDDVSAGP